MFGIIVLFGLVIPCFGAGQLTYVDCSNSTNKVVHFENAKLSHDPLRIPGNETVEIDVLILRPVSGMHYMLRVQLQKKVFLSFVDVPCVLALPLFGGSCDYELCDLLSGRSYNNTHHCPTQIASSTPDFPCSCPFQPGRYHLNPTTFIINEPSGIYTFLAQGDFRIKATITDRNTNEEVGCYIASISTESNCVGPLCLIGKK